MTCVSAASRAVAWSAWALALLGVLAVSSPAAASGRSTSPALTAMDEARCASGKSAHTESAFLRMLLVPGARFHAPRQVVPKEAASPRGPQREASMDWADICRYEVADSAVRVAPRAVLIGDSITEFWQIADSTVFRGGAVVDRGISGQTSGQMLLRFWADVIALHPQIVQILAGTNDIAGNAGPITEKNYEENIEAMVELAQAHHIHVILGAMPPASRFWWAPRYRPAAQINRLNAWLRRYARLRGATFVDYHTLLAEPGARFKGQLSNDGVHPNATGYRIMSAALSAAMEQHWPVR